MNDRFKVLVVGDIMLDVYTYVRSTRMAPEADLPVYDVVSTETRLGGAANVANNLKSLGGDDVDVYLAGIVGLDRNAIPLIREHDISTDACMGGATMVKHRFVDADTHRYLHRVDNIKKFPEKDTSFFEMMSRGVIGQEFHAIVISDYDKGTISEDLARTLVRHPLTVVDSKRKDLRPVEGAKVMKLNESEYSAQVSNELYPYFEGFFEYCVVTLGAKGAELRQCERVKSSDKRYMIHSENFPIHSVEPTDVTGCGDTHTAAMTWAMMTNGGDARSAVRFANERAKIVVQKFGTSV